MSFYLFKKLIQNFLNKKFIHSVIYSLQQNELGDFFIWLEAQFLKRISTPLIWGFIHYFLLSILEFKRIMNADERELVGNIMPLRVNSTPLVLRSRASFI